MISQKKEKTLIMVLICANLISSLVGILYRDGGTTATVTNLFGNQIEMFGNGIYAKNAILTVANRLGGDCVGLLGTVFLIILYSLKNDNKYVIILKAAVIVSSVYSSFVTVFGLTMNRLYLLYVFSLGLSVFLAINILTRYFRCVTISPTEKEKSNTGLSVCLIVFGLIVDAIWISMIIPSLISNNYSDLLGLSSTEVTFAFDIGIICPALLISGFLIRRKNDIGYKIAPLLLYILFSVGPLVIAQNISCIIMGIDIPLPQFIGLIVSFVIISIISFMFLLRSMRMLKIAIVN